MDLTGYDRQTGELLEKLHIQKRDLQPGIFRTLSALKKIAEEEEDITLLGYVYFHRADAYYALEKGYDKFRRDLAKSISCLQRADEPALLMRAYNMVGIDACNNGSLDVAYYYFTMALRTAEEAKDPYLEGLANANIGQVFFELGNLKRARQFVRKSTRQQQGLHMDDVYYYHNMINSWYTDGLLSIRLGDIKSAVRCCKEIDREIEASGGRGLESVAIPIVLLRIQIALAQKDEETYEARVKEMFAMIGDAHQLFDFMSDITLFYMYLIGHNRLKPVRKILNTIGNKIAATGVVHMIRQVEQIEIAYYEKTGNEKQVMKHLRRQHELDTKEKDEHNVIYAQSIHLIESMDSIRKERLELLAENDLLQVQAQTDVLTGIPNRMMMNRLLSSAFERAFAGRHSFGLEILDVDHFKEYNDTYGHQAGDECLQRIAHEIERLSRAPGIHCARYGGDEFVLIYEDMSDEEILEIARELERRIRALNIRHVHGRSGDRISISQGICNSVPQKKNKTWDYLTEADSALYAIKNSLRNGNFSESIRLYHLPGRMIQ